MTETFATETCQHCNKANRVYLGDFSDLTQPDYHSFKCWSCGEVQWLSDTDDYHKQLVQEMFEGKFGHTAEGRPTPNSELELLKERVKWLEEGLRAIVAITVIEPDSCAGRTNFTSPYDVRAVAEHYLKENK